ncbi:MmgE/PrpD family protein (plasmid) [Bosea sp. F3-2]|uniref:MmgE/PrpD family protein n=1 Tax=Bosea sp. F3-2 TaxID=2599640 RepID=UPI0011F07DD9|nr:MmgE/PrpD family protein [Bosea sp. F3-2]QEL27332.1 MmgE/PrpD family protein [Bosea sp. F3-2]
MSEITSRLSDFVSGLRLGDIPADVRERTTILVADSIGIAVRARHESAAYPPLVRAVRKLGFAEGRCAVLGDLDAYSPMAAAMINGTLIHSLDFDDTHAAGALHPSATTLAAALAAAEMESADGSDLVPAIIAGYEVLCRLSKALNPADHYDRGFHPTATCGAFGAAAAAARIMRLSPAQVADAFGIVLSQAAGSMQFLENGAWTKAFQVGHAASAGLLAATLARQGFRGASRAIEGTAGFLHAHAPNPNIDIAAAGLGQVWEAAEIAIKPYPACRFAHAAMDAIVSLRERHSLKLDDVLEITCGLSRKGIDLVGKPIEQKRAAATTVEGQFSMPFLAAVALAEGGMGWGSYDRWLQDHAIRQFMPHVSVVQDPEVEALFPRRFAGAVTMVLKTGETLHEFVSSPKGEPDNFVTSEEVWQKFQALVEPYIGESAAAAFEAIGDLEKIQASRILSLVRPAMEITRVGKLA